MTMKMANREIIQQGAIDLADMDNDFDSKTNKTIASALRKTAKYFLKNPDKWFQGSLYNADTATIIDGDRYGTVTKVTQVCAMGALRYAKEAGLKLTDAEFK